ncbi:hypothetical protein Tco_0079046 [Tanacetum coccineum]
MSNRGGKALLNKCGMFRMSNRNTYSQIGLLCTFSASRVASASSLLAHPASRCGKRGGVRGIESQRVGGAKATYREDGRCVNWSIFEDLNYSLVKITILNSQLLTATRKFDSFCSALRYDALVMQELNSVSDHQMHVSYEEWFMFAEHVLENKFSIIARKVTDSLRSIEVLEEAVSKGHEFEKKVEWGTDLASKHERYLIGLRLPTG